MRMFAVGILAVLASSATADWQSIVLDPSGSTGAFGTAISNGNFFGGTVFGDHIEAGGWTSGNTWFSLHPQSGYPSSWIRGAYANQQVGVLGTKQGDRAAVWNGTAQSYVDLHPPEAFQSAAFATDGVSQVGSVIFEGGVTHGARWNSTNAWTNLTPSGFLGSGAYTVDAGLAGGSVRIPTGYRHASVWSGGASSWRDLHPPTLLADSEIYGIRNGTAVGMVNYKAALWDINSAAITDLHPAGAYSSSAWAIQGENIVGSAMFIGPHHAICWTGSQHSVVDLHQFLEPTFYASEALAVTSNAEGIYVIGYARDYQDTMHAVLWINSVPEPDPVVVFISFLIGCALLRAKFKAN